MTVALPSGAMRLSELVIMYLATAAPFGVARFFAAGRERGWGVRALASACASALLWPRAAFALLRRRAQAAGEGARASTDERRIEQAERAFVSALLSVEDMLEAECGPLGGDERYAMFAARSGVGRYAGLALACSKPGDEEAEAQPTARETELCRVAGRRGEDLRTAGRCVRRRNAALLAAHRERARDELVHALAAAGEAAHKTLAARLSAEDGGHPARAISESLLGAYARAVELFSLFDDRGAVVSAARLMDAECARLRRLGAPAADTQEGVERCTTQAAQGAFATALRSTTT